MSHLHTIMRRKDCDQGIQSEVVDWPGSGWDPSLSGDLNEDRMMEVRMTFVITVLVGFLSFSSAWAGKIPAPLTPDETTRGSLCNSRDPDFKEYRYDEQIPYCERKVSQSMKNRVYSHYRIPSRCRGQYTIDHFYPLSLGGNNGRENLWPEHVAIKRSRQNLETRLFAAIRAGEVSQAEALREIEENKLNPPLKKIERGNYCEVAIALFE